MGLFRKSPPAVCPKCGKADGWRCALSDMPQSMEVNAAPVNSFTVAPIRGSFGQNMTRMNGQRKRARYHCDNCGYEKVF